MFRWFAESAEVAQAENPAAGIDAEGSRVQTSTEEPDVTRFVVTSVAVEAATTITAPEVSVTISASDDPIVGLTPAQDELVPVSRPCTRGKDTGSK